MTGKPRKNPSRSIADRPARWSSNGRSAPTPQAIVSRSSITVPGVPVPLAVSAESSLNRSSPIWNQAPGKGARPCTWRCNSVAGRDQSIRASSFEILAAYVTPSAGCGTSGNALSLAEYLDHGLRAKFGNLFRQLTGTFAIDPDFALEQHRAGIEPGLHLHDGHAGDFVARHDCALHRCRPAPTRQQRAVDIEAAEHRFIEHRLRQDQPVSRDNPDVGVERGELRLRFGGFERGR